MIKMRLTILSLPVFAAAAFVLAGCSQETNTPEKENDSRVPVCVSSNIEVSRAVNNAWEENDAIGIFMLNNGAVDTYSNVEYITPETNGAFAPKNQVIYLPVDGTARDFVAYYPYQSSMANDIYSIDLTNQADQSAIDFMTSDKANGEYSKVVDIDKTSPEVNFRFYHCLSKLRLNIKTGAGFAGDNSELAGMTVKLTNQQTIGTYNVLTGDAVTITPGSNTIELLTAANGQSAEAIVFPSNDYTGMQFEFHVPNHKPYIWELSKSTATKFEEGKSYIYNITINKTEVIVNSTIENWVDGNGAGETGSAE